MYTLMSFGKKIHRCNFHNIQNMVWPLPQKVLSTPYHPIPNSQSYSTIFVTIDQGAEFATAIKHSPF